MARKDELGRWGEQVAAEFLTTEGYAIVDRGWRCSRGEIDVIARQGACTIFVEVKTRRSLRFGHPLEAITATKFSRLKVLAGEWCLAHDSRSACVRIDAIGIIGDGRFVTSLDHRTGVVA